MLKQTFTLDTRMNSYVVSYLTHAYDVSRRLGKNLKFIK